ncbi:hypothetical protein GCM10011609_04510 [Lentzea pudingi]|uniref:Uncharacterized protein n=1 Tax=Lentzea pudingi TaxID=1789439 RepID=A0ABQ2HBA4_9PSEU|nr:hypothetical protein GCM10011609_04510 [Lentzea pudingi]
MPTVSASCPDARFFRSADTTNPPVSVGRCVSRREFAPVVRLPLRVNRRRRFGSTRRPDDRLLGELAAVCGAAALYTAALVCNGSEVHFIPRFSL